MKRNKPKTGLVLRSFLEGMRGLSGVLKLRGSGHDARGLAAFPLAVRALGLGALLLGLAACSGKGEYLREALSPRAELSTLNDQGEELRLVTIATGEAPVMRDVYFVGGSGCASLRSFMATYFKDFPPGYRIHALEKQGVKDRALGLTCSPEFWQSYSYQNLLARNRRSLDTLRRQIDAPLAAIIGVSEGGPIAADLAADAPEIPSLIMLASGAMPQREELEVLAKRRGQEAMLDQALARVAASPDSAEDKTYGMSHRYWSSVLDADPGPAVQRAPQRLMLVIGEDDQNVPVESAQLAKQLRPDAELFIVPGAGHTFSGPGGNQRGEVMQRVGAFIADNTGQNGGAAQ